MPRFERVLNFSGKKSRDFSPTLSPGFALEGNAFKGFMVGERIRRVCKYMRHEYKNIIIDQLGRLLWSSSGRKKPKQVPPLPALLEAIRMQ